MGPPFTSLFYKGVILPPNPVSVLAPGPPPPSPNPLAQDPPPSGYRLNFGHKGNTIIARVKSTGAILKVPAFLDDDEGAGGGGTGNVFVLKQLAISRQEWTPAGPRTPANSGAPFLDLRFPVATPILQVSVSFCSAFDLGYYLIYRESPRPLIALAH